MAHLRNRGISVLFQKKSKFWPVLCLFGPRQCGKTTFLRDLLTLSRAPVYRTLDQSAQRRLARANPALYLSETETSATLIVDEAHKAPELFDEIKSIVDRKRKPCSFILSGSVKFSKKVGIRESLTGRSASVYLDTLSLAETLQKEKNVKAEPISLMAVKKIPGPRWDARSLFLAIGFRDRLLLGGMVGYDLQSRLKDVLCRQAFGGSGSTNSRNACHL